MRLHKSNGPIVCKMKKDVWNICAAIMWTRWAGCFHVPAASGGSPWPPFPKPSTPPPFTTTTIHSPSSSPHTLYMCMIIWDQRGKKIHWMLKHRQVEESFWSRGPMVCADSNLEQAVNMCYGHLSDYELTNKKKKKKLNHKTQRCSLINMEKCRHQIHSCQYSANVLLPWLTFSQSLEQIYFCALVSSSQMFWRNV